MNAPNSISVEPWYRNPWVIAIVVTIATFMEVLDATIVNVSLPHIAGNLSAGLDESTWVLTSYLVANAIVLPISGWLSSAIGRKRFYMICVATFTVASFLCGLAPSLELLVFFRVLQGIGGGGMQPSEQAILVDTFPAHKRGMAFAVAGIAMVTAPILGPTLGGWITDHYSWRWCFYINVPVGLLSLALTSKLVRDKPDQKAEGLKGRLDLTGLFFIALGLGCLQVVLDTGNRDDWFESNSIMFYSTLAVIGLIAAVVWEWTRANPIVDLHLLKNRNFAVANLMMFCIGFVIFGSTMLIPQMLETLMGYTAIVAGMVISPGGIVVICLMPAVGMLVTHWQPKYLVVFGFLLMASGLLMMTRFTMQMSPYSVALARCVQASGMAFLFVPTNTIAYSQLPPGKNNNASAILSLSRNLGGSFGIALATMLIQRRAQFHQSRMIEHLTPYDANMQNAVKGLTQTLIAQGQSATSATQIAIGKIYAMTIQHATMAAFLDAFFAMSMLALLLIPVTFLIRKVKRTPGAAAVGH